MDFLYSVIAILVALTFHEFAHGYVSWKLGDPTPKAEKRLSFNPLNHLDLMGTACLFLFGFGWAKPVRVNTEYYKNKKQGMVLTALAGPVMNFILALICGVLIKINVVPLLFERMLLINLGLGVFNLIPIPPLDGSKVLLGVLPKRIYFNLMKYEGYGFIVLMILLLMNVITKPLFEVITFLQTFIYSIVGII